jgi:hypothetical protein
MADNIATYASIIILLVVGVLGVGAAFSGATHTYTETADYALGTDITYGNETTVNISHPPATTFYDNETLTNTTDDVLTESIDYRWNTTRGGLTVYNTSNTSVGGELTLDYAYEGHTDRARAAANVLGLGYRIGAISLLIGGAVVVARWTSWAGGGR